MLNPQLTHSPDLLQKASNVRWAIFDVDGVLTDGRIYISAHGEEFKAFCTLDGHGLKLLSLAGITPVIITGRDSAAVRRRVADLGLQHAIYGVTDKAVAAQKIMSQLELGWDTLAAMGDDWPDLPLMTQAAFACAPANAHLEVKSVADHVTQNRGGYGAARELCDLLLLATGHYAVALRHHATTLDSGSRT
jgi:3-deoxy-D-manno-octulosonate 8-phosphate phosphatase (KDO 8-P phosphatase)